MSVLNTIANRVSRSKPAENRQVRSLHTRRGYLRGSALKRLTPITDLASLDPCLCDRAFKLPILTEFKPPDANANLCLNAGLSPILSFGQASWVRQARETRTVLETRSAPEPAETSAIHPYWNSVVASENGAKFRQDDSPRPSRDQIQPEFAPLELWDTPLDPESTVSTASEGLVVEHDSSYDSPIPFRGYRLPPHARLWQAIRAFTLSRGFSWAVAACVLVLIASTLEVPWPSSFYRPLQIIKNSLAAVGSALTRPIDERSAFFIVDDFSAGLGNWVDNGSLSVTDVGYLAVTEGVSLHSGTLNFRSYRLDFEAKILSEAVGWVVRATNTDNYYAFKLVRTDSDSQELDLLRFAVVGGVKDTLQGTTSVAVPEHVTATADFNRISVRVQDNQITTLVNGWGVDFWQDDRFDRGGVGLLADGDESALVRKLSITGNEDTWGLILYGMRETIRSVHGAFSAPFALQIVPGANNMNAAIGVSPMRQTFLLEANN